MKSLPSRLLGWAGDSAAALLDVFLPADGHERCVTCDAVTPKHVQPCTKCFVAQCTLTAAEEASEDTPYCNRCGRPHPVNGVCGRDAVCGTCGLKLVDYEHTLCAVDFPDPAASATADPSPAISPAGGAGPEGLSHSPRDPSGPPNDDLVDLIAEVLADHHDYSIRWEAVICICGAPLITDGYPNQRLRAHVAPLIAERIEKATPPAQVTSTDLTDAARYVRWWSEADECDDAPEHLTYLRGLADRLEAAADPTP